jgi:hypothetical protein
MFFFLSFIAATISHFRYPVDNVVAMESMSSFSDLYLLCSHAVEYTGKPQGGITVPHFSIATQS